MRVLTTIISGVIHMKKYIGWMAAAFFVIIVAVAVMTPSRSPEPPKQNNNQQLSETGVTTGKTMPVISLPALDGRIVTAPRGKVTVINFWATWCPPCREEMPELERFAKEYSQSVAFYAVNVQEPGDKVKEFMSHNKYAMPVLLDGEGVTAKTFRISAIPTTIVTDKDGVIRYRKAGGVTMSELEGVIKGL